MARRVVGSCDGDSCCSVSSVGMIQFPRRQGICWILGSGGLVRSLAAWTEQGTSIERPSSRHQTRTCLRRAARRRCIYRTNRQDGDLACRVCGLARCWGSQTPGTSKCKLVWEAIRCPATPVLPSRQADSVMMNNCIILTLCTNTPLPESQGRRDACMGGLGMHRTEYSVGCNQMPGSSIDIVTPPSCFDAPTRLVPLATNPSTFEP